MLYINSSEKAPNKAFYYKSDSEPYSPELAIKYIDKKAEFERNQTKTLGTIKSIISQDNIDRFKDKVLALVLWDAINSTYSESSLEIITRYFNKIIKMNYNSFKNTNKYTSYIQSTALYLKDLGYLLLEPFIAIFLFKGLSSSFDSFSSRKYKEIANELKNNKTQKDYKGPLINISKLISDIISKESRISTNKDSQANKTSPNNPFCIYCKRIIYIKDKY
jgi:hypothetical protein